MTDFFSPDYFTARDRFRAGVLRATGQIESILLQSKGPAREELTIDIGWFGAAAPRRAFVHSSGLHGVEGFAGSAIQLQWLEEGIAPPPTDGAVAIVHALNPFGMAWLRRVNENNVDLDRNFLAADEEYSGAPELYASLNSFLNPLSPPTRDFFRVRAAFKAWRCGVPAFRQAVEGGQYDFPRGLFFGGHQREQEARRFQVYVTDRFSDVDRLVGIDVHTGPGRFGEDHLLADCGALGGLYPRMFPAARVHFAVQEFGIRDSLTVLAALRDENRCHYFGGARPDLLEVFCPANIKWRGKVLARGKEAISQGLALAFESAQPPPTV